MTDPQSKPESVRAVVLLRKTETREGFSGPGSIVAKLSLAPIADKEGVYKEFFAATPGGGIELDIANETAARFFEYGQPYFVTFTRAPK